MRDIGSEPEDAVPATARRTLFSADLAAALTYPGRAQLDSRQTAVRDSSRRIPDQAHRGQPPASANSVPPVRNPRPAAARPAPITGMEMAT